jgi:hypothetical protein
MFAAVRFNDWIKSLLLACITTNLSIFADLKTECGALYAVISTSILGGLLPFLYLFLRDEIKFLAVTQLLFYIIIWEALGGLINEFYDFQILLFCKGTDWLTIFKKTAFDQFVFSVFVTSLFIALAFLVKD